ncbi:cell division protein FtsA [Paracoccaceae bacterium]|nr:cell division protein FtsA [Paracoccaceae bacterium]
MTNLYETQRAMRQARKIAIQRGVIAVLDVGTSKVACFVLKFDGVKPRELEDSVGSMVGQADFRIIGVSTIKSRGVKFGDIDIIRETERAIRTAVQAAQKMAGVRVDHIIACFSGGRPRSYGLSGSTVTQNGMVDTCDIANVLGSCEVPQYGSNRDALHAHPVNFSLDNKNGLLDPSGQIGKNLSVDMHLLTVDSSSIEAILHCVKRCDLELAGIASSAYVSAISSLVEDEQEIGAACVDMGGGTTGVSVFLKKHMVYGDFVKMGGDHITSDISHGLQIPINLAERIKNLNGGVLATGMDDRESIQIGGDTGDWEHDKRSVTRSELIGIIRPRVEEILEGVRETLLSAGFEFLPSQRIVLTGGASQIPGLDQLAAKILGQQVRMGRPLRVRGLPQAASAPGFSAVVGLALFAAYPQDEWWDFELTNKNYAERSIKRMTKWLRENW